MSIKLNEPCLPPAIVLEPQQYEAKYFEYPGFLFAFYRYSQSHKKSIIERFVSMAISSDYIHVGIIPVQKGLIESPKSTSTMNLPSFNMYTQRQGRENCYLDLRISLTREPCLEIKKLELHDQVYTAFVGCGFEVQHVSAVLNDAYEYVFYPLSDLSFFLKGVSFLNSLKGSGYNYLILPFTILPRRFKLLEKEKVEKNDPQCHQNFSFRRSVQDDIENFNTKTEEKECMEDVNEHRHHHTRVICSEIGLSLLYHCDPFLHQKLNPMLCLPGELKFILGETPYAMPCQQSVFEIHCAA